LRAKRSERNSYEIAILLAHFSPLWVIRRLIGGTYGLRRRSRRFGLRSTVTASMALLSLDIPAEVFFATCLHHASCRTYCNFSTYVTVGFVSQEDIRRVPRLASSLTVASFRRRTSTGLRVPNPGSRRWVRFAERSPLCCKSRVPSCGGFVWKTGQPVVTYCRRKTRLANRWTRGLPLPS
jgi:hypothetical protein